MKICKKCGASNKDTSNFCTSCGRKLERAVVTSSASRTNTGTVFQIVFRRPESLVAMFNVLHVKIDNTVSYELKNGGEVKIPVSPGQHFVEISMFSQPLKKKFYFMATDSMTFICKPDPVGALTFSVPPAKVTDINGREY